MLRGDQLDAAKVIFKMSSLGEELLGTVNKLQDLVFNTIGNDSLDLPQIVSPAQHLHLHLPRY